MLVIQRINVKLKLKKWQLLKTNRFEKIESIIYLNQQKITYGYLLKWEHKYHYSKIWE